MNDMTGNMITSGTTYGRHGHGDTSKYLAEADDDDARDEFRFRICRCHQIRGQLMGSHSLASMCVCACFVNFFFDSNLPNEMKVNSVNCVRNNSSEYGQCFVEQNH